MGIGAAIVLGLFGLVGSVVGYSMNNQNNDFVDDMNEDNQNFQERVNQQNYQWSREQAEWEYEHNKPQRQYADLRAAGLTPAAAAQKLSGANVSYTPATAIAPQNAPKSMDIFSDSLSQVFDELGNFANVEQTLASAEKTRAETKVINETGVNKAMAEIDKILADTLKSYSDIEVNDSQIDVNESNVDLIGERVSTEQVNRRAIELSNEEKQIQLEFTRKTLEMSIQKTEGEIKLLSEQTAKLQEEVGQMEFENKYQEWRNTYIETYGVAPEQGWEDTLFKAVIDGKAKPMLDAFTESLRQIFGDPSRRFSERQREKREKREFKRQVRKNAVPGNFSSIGDWYGFGASW